MITVKKSIVILDVVVQVFNLSSWMVEAVEF
jgi:hypothetical protein